MKKIILLLSLLLSCAAAFAQEGLMVSWVFSDAVTGRDKVETKITGRRLKPYKLSLYRHCKVSVTEEDLNRIAGWIGKDSEKASEKETEYQDGKLVYALARIEDPEVGNKYVCYQVKSRNNNDRTYRITVVYLEGKATLGDLENIFKK